MNLAPGGFEVIPEGLGFHTGADHFVIGMLRNFNKVWQEYMKFVNTKSL